MLMKNSSDTIGNRTRNLPACSAAPQPTVPPRTPRCTVRVQNSQGFSNDISVRQPPSEEPFPPVPA